MTESLDGLRQLAAAERRARTHVSRDESLLAGDVIFTEGRDLMAAAQTGTGKTAGFALPLLQRLSSHEEKVSSNSIRALVLVPTRELAMQVAEAIHKYAKGTGVTSIPLYGGASMDQQIRALSRGCDIVIATPGRALDHMRRETLDLSALEVLVLDEADEMLDMGFAEDLDAILTATPAERQTALFAATFAPRITAITHRHLRQPERLAIKGQKPAAGAVPKIRQTAFVVPRPQKLAAFARVLEFEDPKSAIVFCRTRLEVDELTDTLKAHGYGAQALHGGMEQKQRDRVMQMFRGGKADMLVATDVAARGLDIAQLEAVINVDVSPDIDTHTHRIGRTGRAGEAGWAFTLASMDEMGRVGRIDEAQGHASVFHPVSELTPSSDPQPLRPPRVTLQILGGRKEKIRPGDVLGALTKDMGLAGSQIGKINVNDFSTYVAVDRDIAARALKGLNAGKVKGKSVKARAL